MRPLIVLSLFAAALVAPDDLKRPYLDANDRAAASSPLTLVEIYNAGTKRHQARATQAMSRLEADKELRTALEEEGALAGASLSSLDLARLAATESGVSKSCEPDEKGRIGLFRLDVTSCHDVKVAFDDVDEPDEWRKHVETGRKLYVRLSKSLLHHLDQDHGLGGGKIELTPLHLYLAHRTSAEDSARLLAQIHNGTARTQSASAELLSYLEGDPRVAALFDSKHDVRAIEVYVYLLGGWSSMLDKVKPQPAKKD